MSGTLHRPLLTAVGLALAAASFLSNAATSSPPALARGKYLTAIAGCESCHTGDKGQPFAGGLVMQTPFGSVTTPNITPDRTTGIGAWTDEQFYKAMHDGLGRNGEYLYPVMPFPWYTRASREDVQAIKAYLFSLPPVRKANQKNNLKFPFNIRQALSVWRLAFFKAGEFKPDPSHSAEVNRGDYLVNGLAHCGECHDSRVLAGQSRFQKPLQGGVVSGWYAPNITSDVHDGIGGWSDEQLAQFLKTGSSPGKGVAVGPMTESVHNLAQLTDADLKAMVAYLKSTPPQRAPEARLGVDADGKSAGGQRYLDNCASCHGVKGEGLAGVVPALAGNPTVNARGPENVVQVILGGLTAQKNYAPMIAIGAAMDDADIASVANYVRQNWGNEAPANATPEMVGKLRPDIETLMTAGRRNGCPDISGSESTRAVVNGNSSLQAALAATNESNMPQQVEQIVAKTRAAAPRAGKADIVNGLTSAYCRVVRADDKLDWNAKALQLGHFSELVYTQASSNGLLTTATRGR